jgi:uncharacterized membrane protein (Fun14 family)
MVAIDPQQIGIEAGTGAVIGGLIGFAAKKIAKIIAVIIGLELALFRFLETKGYLTVNWEKISGGILRGGQQAADASGTWLNAIISTLSIGAGFTGGFLVGFKRG